MFAEDYKINKQQLEIEQQMLDNKGIEDYELYDSMAALADLIKNCNIIEKEAIIKKYFKYINSELIEYMYVNKKIFFEFNYMLDVLKSKSKNFEKDSKEKKILKNIQKELKNIYKVYNEKNKKKPTSPYFNIINYWLQDDMNYLYIKELLKRHPEVYNCYDEDKHIVEYLVEQYIENFKKMIVDKNGTYINKNYIKNIYYLFTKSYKVRLTKEQKSNIDLMLKEFSLYIKNTLIKEKRKNAALNEIKEMKTCKYFETIETIKFKEFSDDNLSYEQHRISSSSDNMVKNSLALPAFVLGDHAYRISKGNNTIILKMFSIDVHDFVKEKSIMNYYFESCAYKEQKPDEFFTKNIKFNKNKKYPVISYNLEFFPSGKIKSLSISKDIVLITNKYNTLYDGSEEVKEIYDLFVRSVSKNGGEKTDYNLLKVNEHFEQILTEKYIEFAQVNKLPIMYYGYSMPDKLEYERHLCDLSPYFSEINKQDARDIVNIISSKIDKQHYSIIPIKNGVYDLNLIDSFNYLGLINQRMINDLYFNQRQLENPLRLYKLKLEYLNKHYNNVMEINKALNYVDRSEIKETKGKIKRKLRI